MMHLLTVVGARPNFIKLCALHSAFRERSDIEHCIIHTGQHYDYEMNEFFFQELKLPDPDHHLGVGSGTVPEQLGQTMMALEPILEAERPDWVIVVGDVNATAATAIVAKQTGLPLAHVEAGLRSFDWSMPEEINRMVTDRLADLLFVSEPSGVKNLREEGVEDQRIHWVGNVMIDTLLQCLPMVENRDTGKRFGVRPKAYAVVTIHRPSNTEPPERLRDWMRALEQVAEQMPIIFPIHPRTQKVLDALGYVPKQNRLQLTKPVGYLDMLALMKDARIVLTDSGGIQEETTALAVPCLTLRDNTERPATLQAGTNTLVGSDPSRLPAAWEKALRKPLKPQRPEKWDGRAGQRIAEQLIACASLARRQR